MPFPYFTVENARENAKLSWETRRARAANASIMLVEATDAFQEGLAQAMQETLGQFRESTVPKDKAMLAKALRDLRETWHMVTGRPKPGMIKHVERAAMKQLPPAPDTPSV